MVTTQNYFDTILRIDWNKVPDSLKKTRDTLIPDASREDWQIYNSDADVRRVVEKYFGYIGKYVSAPKGAKPVTDVSKPATRKAKSSDVSEATKKEAHALALDLIRSYVLRGDTLEDLKKSYLGRSNDAGSAMIKSDKIIVDRIGKEAINISFSLRSIFNEIKKDDSAETQKPKKGKAVKAKAEVALPEAKQVTHIPTSTAFIKRYAALHGKVKTRDQILSLTHGLQKAITEQRIRKDNPATQEIEKMQAELIKLATTMDDSAKIEIDAQSLAHYKEIAQGEEVRTSVKLLKQFIQINGKSPDKTKAETLGKKMADAYDTIPKEDAYRSELAAAAKAVAAYVSSEVKTIGIPTASLHGLGAIATGSGMAGLGRIVPGSGEGAIVRLLREEKVKNLSDAALKKAFRQTVVPSLCLEMARDLIRRGELTMEVLNNPPSKKKYMGIAGVDNNESLEGGRITDLDILEMRLKGAGSQVSGLGMIENNQTVSIAPVVTPGKPISAATPAQSETVSARDLAKMRFKTIGYIGRFKDVVGDPSVGFHMMVYGKPYNGKSSFVIELCKDLAALNKGKIAYLALEEGISLSMQKKVIDRGADKVDGLEFKGSMPTSFEGYGFIVIDSVSDRSISREKLREMFLAHPNTSFICIFHATKAGSARGGLDYSHDMDIIIRIEDHKPAVEKNRFL